MVGEGKLPEKVEQVPRIVRIGDKHVVVNILKNKHVYLYMSLIRPNTLQTHAFLSRNCMLHMVWNLLSQPALGDAKYLMTPHLETINTFESVLDSWGKGC